MNFGKEARVWAYDRRRTVFSLPSGELAGAGGRVPVVLSDRIASPRRTARHAVPTRHRWPTLDRSDSAAGCFVVCEA